MYRDISIDLETMGMPPTGAIIGLGACMFDMQTCTIGPTFYRAVNLATSVRAGMTLEPSTIMWWLGQSQEAREAVRFSTTALETALTEFSEFVAEHSRVQDVRPWGNASSFDLTILGSAYKLTGIKQPWYFTNERCFRTVRCMYPAVEYNPDDKGAGAHNALADAVFQAEHLFKIKNRNKKPVATPFAYARFADNGYEVSRQGDTRFSALYAKLSDGRTVEMHYQCDVKGYQPGGTNWKLGKGKPPLTAIDTWAAYRALWGEWASLNPAAIEDLRKCATGKTLTDKFATSPISQARALAEILNESAK